MAPAQLGSPNTSAEECSAAEEKESRRASSTINSVNGRRKTKSTACRRCHSRKVKCSGGTPCDNCRQASKGAECSYPRKNRLVKVTQQYLDDLLAENQRLKSRDNGLASRHASNPNIAEPPPVSAKLQGDTTPIMPAPSLQVRPWFFDMNVPHTPILIGEASDAAFATRFRQAISDSEHSHIPRVNYATDERLLALSDADTPWPTPARARFLVNVALKYVTHCYHIVRKSTVQEGLEQVIQNANMGDSLFKSKLWALFAIGEMYSTRTAVVEKNFPGIGYFARATRILQIVSERPRIDAIEVRLLLSFYSLGLNRRHSAYALAGSAMRLSVVMGLHLNVPESQLSDAGAREHRTRVWWTAYIFDRMWASKLGHPVSVRDDVIEVDLPSNPIVESGTSDFRDCAYFVASVRLARLSGRIVHSIYSRKVEQKSLSQRVQEALKDLRQFVQDLPSHLHIESSDAPEPSPKPISLSLNLCFNQCAISATRPILLHILRTQVATWGTDSNPEPQVPASAKALAEACVRCARHSCRLLTEAWIEGSFYTFDYFYTQYLFSAATVLAVSSMLDTKDSRSDREQFDTASQFLFQLHDNGNFAAGEFCNHLNAMKATMTSAQLRKGGFTLASDSQLTDPALGNVDLGLNTPADATAGMALCEPSLQDLLAQPMLDLQFIDASMYHDVSQGLYWPDISPESWTPDTWAPGV